jgi:hypothetical protein
VALIALEKTSAGVQNDHHQLRGTVYSDEQLTSGRQSCFPRPISCRGFRSVADFQQNKATSKTLHKKSRALNSSGSRRYSNRSCTPPPSIGKTIVKTCPDITMVIKGFPVFLTLHVSSTQPSQAETMRNIVTIAKCMFLGKCVFVLAQLILTMTVNSTRIALKFQTSAISENYKVLITPIFLDKINFISNEKFGP